MGIEDLKRYQWVGIGLAAGLMAGGLRVSFDGQWADAPVRTISQTEFESALIKAQPDGRPTLDQVVVHPPDEEGTWWVTGRRRSVLALHTDPTDPLSPRVETEVRTPFKYPAAFPYVATQDGLRTPPGASEDVSIAGFIKRLHETTPKAAPSYAYAWYEPPVARVAVWTVGSAILIGGLWPPLLGFLVGAGFGRKKVEPFYDLNRFESETVSTHADQSVGDIDIVLDALIAAQSVSGTDQATVDEPSAKSPVRILPAALETPKAVPDASDANKSYGGEFYPTIIHPAKEASKSVETAQSPR